MTHGVTLKAVRDELAALGHNLSEKMVASLLADAGAAGLLEDGLDEVDGSDEQYIADHNGVSDGYPAESGVDYCNESLQCLPGSRNSSNSSPPQASDGEQQEAGHSPRMMDDDDEKVCSHTKWTSKPLSQVRKSKEPSTHPVCTGCGNFGTVHFI